MSNRSTTKARAHTEWNPPLLNALGTGSSRQLRTNTTYEPIEPDPAPAHAPAGPVATQNHGHARPASERHTAINPNRFWMGAMHQPSYSIFSMNGYEAMLQRMASRGDDFSLETPRLRPQGTANSNGSSDLPRKMSFGPLDRSGTARESNQSHLSRESTMSSVWGDVANPVASLNLAFLQQQTGKSVSPEEVQMVISEIEAKGEWIEARTTLTGRILWYNTASNRLVFDTAPDGVKPISSAQFAKSLGSSNDDYLASRPIEPYEGEDVVDALLNFGMHKWNFENDLVFVYRAHAWRRDHAKMLPDPTQYCFPEYMSESPLPELPGNQFLAKIRLPEKFSAHRRYVTIRIKMDYTAACDAIKQGVEKLDEEYQNSDLNEFLLKVVGQEEYIYGRRKIVDYEAVRNAVRNEDDIEFVLIQRKDFNESVQAASVKQKEYEKTFKTAYQKNLTEPEFLYNLGKSETLSPAVSNGSGFEPQTHVSLYDCDWHYRLKIEGLTNVFTLSRFDDATMRNVYVVVELWMGDVMFKNATLMTKHAGQRSEIRWGQWLSTRNLTFSQIPREAVLCFMVMGVVDGVKEDKCLAWCRMPLVDHRDRLRRGRYLLNMWDIPQFRFEKDGPKTDPWAKAAFRYRGTTRDKHVKDVAAEQCQILVEFDEFAFEVLAPKYPPKDMKYNEAAVGGKLKRNELSKDDKRDITNIIAKNPLEQLTVPEKDLLWRARDLLWHDPSALPSFLRSVNWTSRLHIAEAHKYLSLWSPPKEPADALEFLDYRFADTTLREQAVKWLDDIHDGDLVQFLLQLVQCLKYEPHHDSSLAQFLVRRALKNPYQIGHFLFWHLKAEFHKLEVCERFGVIMEEYLKHAGEHSRQLFIQSTVLKRLEIIAEKVFKAKHSTTPEQCKRLLKKELGRLNRDLPATIQIPLNPRWSARKIKVEKCRYMGSKKVPLWLVFENADEYASDIMVMFKSGDDLRQDMLTLQIIGVMDQIWLHNKLDLHLKPYGVIATGVNRNGEGVGMLELVQHSETVNTINVENGGAFNEKTINAYLMQHNRGDNNIKKARENFARSCSGYCVATFVMGIGDRHSDNIMVSKSGQFFHIDFGHFLGNFKSKFKIKRERSPFVFTPAMKFAIDGGQRKSPLYENFLEWCSEAYNILRLRSRLLLVLFALMVSAGMPELMQESDIMYFRNMLNLHYDQTRATEHLHKLVNASLRDRSRLLDNAIHAAVHK